MAWIVPILVLALSAVGAFPDDGGRWLLHFVVAAFAAFLAADSFYRRDIAWGCILAAVAVVYQPFIELPLWQMDACPPEAEYGVPQPPCGRAPGFLALIAIGVFGVHWLIWTRGAARRRRNNTLIHPGN